jgi:hypothetical protein
MVIRRSYPTVSMDDSWSTGVRVISNSSARRDDVVATRSGIGAGL